MGGRTDSEFWRYVSSGATQTDFVRDLLETAKHRIPSWGDFVRCHKGVGWELYCYVMAGIGKLDRQVLEKLFTRETWEQTAYHFDTLRASLGQEYIHFQTFPVFVEYFRSMRNNFINSK